jgi:hypothetical protein
MAEMVSYCGLRCDRCPAYIARRTGDRDLRERTAREWSAQYNAEIAPADIACDGCMPGAELQFAHCSECDIRACGIAKGVDSCARCSDYPCSRLVAFFEWVPEARDTLDALRKASNAEG